MIKSKRIRLLEELPEGCIAIILSCTTPVDACRLSNILSKSFRSAADSDTVWDRFLTSDSIILQSPSPANTFTKKGLYMALSDRPIIIDQGTKVFYFFIFLLYQFFFLQLFSIFVILFLYMLKCRAFNCKERVDRSVTCLLLDLSPLIVVTWTVRKSGFPCMILGQFFIFSFSLNCIFLTVCSLVTRNSPFKVILFSMSFDCSCYPH